MATVLDHPKDVEATLHQAAARLAARGATLTELRRTVLRMILSSRQPVGAYTLLERLGAERGRAAAPPTVYRALDFLLEHRLIHRIERLNAFIACAAECTDGHAHAHPAQFLICEVCGDVQELEDAGVARALTDAARQAGFRHARATVEMEGTCAACAKAA
jgi:Fur family zinc uptake transcriptional regulator